MMFLTEQPACPDDYPDYYCFREDGKFICCESAYISADGTYVMKKDTVEITITDIYYLDGPPSRVNNKWTFFYKIEDYGKTELNNYLYRCDRIFVTDKPLHIVMAENMDCDPRWYDIRSKRLFIDAVRLPDDPTVELHRRNIMRLRDDFGLPVSDEVVNQLVEKNIQLNTQEDRYQIFDDTMFITSHKIVVDVSGPQLMFTRTGFGYAYYWSTGRERIVDIEWEEVSEEKLSQVQCDRIRNIANSVWKI